MKVAVVVCCLLLVLQRALGLHIMEQQTRGLFDILVRIDVENRDRSENSPTGNVPSGNDPTGNDPTGDLWARCFIQVDSGDASQPVIGTVYFNQKGQAPVDVWVNLEGFDTTDGLNTHGFHIHENSELGDSCADAGGHYNPENVEHGGPDDIVRHVGDLGNIVEDSQGRVDVHIQDSVISLSGYHSIVDRTVVVHSTFDDLGRGPYEDSKTTGHAGARVGCCVVESISPPNPALGPWRERVADCTIIESTTGMTSQPIEGTVVFKQPPGFAEVTVSVDLSGFDVTDGLDIHGFHVHEYGELGDTCKDAGGHFNPEQVEHGGPDDIVRHVGDLGNVKECSAGNVKTDFSDRMVRMEGPHGIVGKSVVVHETFDDFNTGGYPDSSTTGHAGGRLGCCVINERRP